MDINDMLKIALQNYHSENFQIAVNLCKEILKINPNNITALNLLVRAYYRNKDYNSTIIYAKILINLNPNDFQSYYMLGHSLQEIGELDDAIFYYQESLKINPKNSDAYYNLGAIFQDKMKYDESIYYYKKCLEFNPNDFDAYYNIAHIFQIKKDFESSLNYYNQALQINPALPDAYNNIGIIFQEKKQLKEAKISFQNALYLNPYLSDAYLNLGIIFLEEKKYNEAISYFYKSLQFKPDDIKTLISMGSALSKLEKYDDSISFYQRALQLSSNDVNALIGMGSSLCKRGQFDEAISFFHKAISFKQDDPNILALIGSTLRQKGDFTNALNYYNRLLQIDSNNVYGHYGKSFILLLFGNFDEGWKEYEWRWKEKEYLECSCFRSPDSLLKPIMKDLNIDGLTVLLYAEQGLGDEIQFVRYAPLVSQLGAKVIVECNRNLSTLFQYVPGISQIVIQGEMLPDFDIQCPFLNLPLAFGTKLDNIPSKVPYILIPRHLIEGWCNKIMNRPANLKIGLVWAGNPKHQNDKNRSIPLSLFSPLFELSNVDFYSLQKGKGSEQIKHLKSGSNLINLTDDINDFLDTAALIENLDLVITVDTAVAHLAGALGKPVWTLLPFLPDWRWMLNREDSPWYPTMRLFRQPSYGDWKSVIEKVKKELGKLLQD